MKSRFLAPFLAFVLFNASAAWATNESPRDPFEPVNRAIFAFNDTLDTYALRPLALGYRYVTPDPVERRVSDFFSNLDDVRNIVYSTAKGEFNQAGVTTARVTFNTIFGLGGLFDVATPMGLPRKSEDLGTVLASWGVPSGPYVVLPIFGPSSVRDSLGVPSDMVLSPINYYAEADAAVGLTALNVVQTRAQFLGADQLVTGDRYLFMRDSYLQSRAFSVSQGQAEDYDDSNF